MSSHGYGINYYKQIPEPDWDEDGWATVVFDMHSLTAGGLDWYNSNINRLRLDLFSNGMSDYNLYLMAIGSGTLEDIKLLHNQFTRYRFWPTEDINFEGLVDTSRPATEFITDLLAMMDAQMWYNEDQQITVRKNLPTEPDFDYVALTDDGNFVLDSPSIDMNEKKRFTRIGIRWERDGVKGIDSSGSYLRGDVSLDAAQEDEKGYGKKTPREINAYLLTTLTQSEELVQAYAKAITGRILLRLRTPNPLLAVEMEAKDADLKTGDYVRVSTEQLLEADGSPYVNKKAIIRKRQQVGSAIRYTLEIFNSDNLCFIQDDTTSTPVTFDAASLDEREYGFIDFDDGTIGAGRTNGYMIY